MSEWISGRPEVGGKFWLLLKPTEKIPKRMRKNYITCFSSICNCHQEILHRRTKRIIDDGLYTIEGFIKLPEPPEDKS